LYLFLTGNALVGIAWGLAPFVLVPDDNLLHLAFVALWVCALAAGSVAAYATIFTAFLAFTLPAILPLAGHLFLLGTPETTAIAASLLSYLVFLTLTASNARKILTQALEVQFDNIERINDLNNLNRQLNADIERRQRTELELRIATQQVQELWHLSSVDGLTGIANRRHFDEYLEKEWGRCLRDWTPMSLILCDIDFFKPYNDRYGHQAGDDCLCAVAGLLKIFARRPGDLASRYGGEEFVLVLPRTATRHATRIAEQVRQGIESLHIQHLESQVSNVITASFGVGTVIPRRELTPKTLIGRVDKALYEAKQAGRNRVVIAAALS
jgi:diguanylate cyclase (GGDEF)-like protein